MSQWTCKKCGEPVDENVNSDTCLKCMREEFFQAEKEKREVKEIL